MCHSKRTEMCQPYLYKVVLRFLFPLIAFIKEIVDPSLENSYLPQYKLKSNPAEDLSDADASWDSIQNSKMMIRLLKRLFINAFFVFLLSLSLFLFFSPIPSRLYFLLNCFVLQRDLLSIRLYFPER